MIDIQLKNEIETKIFTVEKLDHYARGIVHYNKMIGFIENALPTEQVKIEITHMKKKFFEGKVTEFLTTSPERVIPICPHYLECGGCSLSHLTYQEENKFKEQKVTELVEKFTEVDKIKIKKIVSSTEYNYRNKITLHVKNKKIGYYKVKTNDLLEIDSCPLVSDKINDILPELKELVKINNITEIIIRTSTDESKLMLKIMGEKVENYQELLAKVDVLYINDKCLTKDNKIITTIKDKKYYLSIDSFFQVNRFLTDKLYDEVRNVVKENKYNKVLDLYCGTGTIGLYISDYVDEVIGIDYSKSNIADANDNKLLNGSNNISFICSKVEDVIENYKEDIDLIVVDPPRAGLDKKTIKTLKTINPKVIVYISCDPVTFARDIKELDTYDVQYIKPFNMFSKTYHVENVAVLHQK